MQLFYLLFLYCYFFSHFVLIKQGEKFKQEIPALKENKQNWKREVEVLNGNIKHGKTVTKKVGSVN